VILLDTHVFIWLFMGDARLGAKAKARIQKAQTGDKVAVSAITIWETSMLAARGRVDLGRDISRWIALALSAPGVDLAPIDAEIGVDAGRLPGDIHGDPADRIIVATARFLNCPLLTTDRAILEYSRAGHVEAVDARL
jgi:PIN domain nuclease of toxin-antitoxin system